MRKLMVLIAVLALVSVASANLLTNPGFETEGATVNDAEDWWRYSEAGREGWAAQPPSSFGMAFWAWTDGGYGGFGQDYVANLNVGDVITFSIWGLAEANYNSGGVHGDPETWLSIEYWQDGQTTWTSQYQWDFYTEFVGDRGNWNQYTLIHTVELANVTMIKPIVGGGNFIDNTTGEQSAFFDNASLTIQAIPEPTAVALLGLGGLMACMLRRKTRK